jgi:hypothetical protein
MSHVKMAAARGLLTEPSMAHDIVGHMNNIFGHFCSIGVMNILLLF